MLLFSAGNTFPSASDIENALSSAGVDADEASLIGNNGIATGILGGGNGQLGQLVAPGETALAPVAAVLAYELEVAERKE